VHSASVLTSCTKLESTDRVPVNSQPMPIADGEDGDSNPMVTPSKRPHEGIVGLEIV
jgi:hypothetical protein